jgi:hypothetical protein
VQVLEVTMVAACPYAIVKHDANAGRAPPQLRRTHPFAPFGYTTQTCLYFNPASSIVSASIACFEVSTK